MLGIFSTFIQKFCSFLLIFSLLRLKRVEVYNFRQAMGRESISEDFYNLKEIEKYICDIMVGLA